MRLAIAVVVFLASGFAVVGDDLTTAFDIQVQQLLAERGCNPGTPDGQWGKRSSQALARYEEQGGARVERPFDASDLALLAASDTACPLPLDPEVTFKAVAATRVNFGGRLENNAHMLDVLDIDGDGAEDFLLSGETENTDKPKDIRTFVVRNEAVSGKFEATDLGEDGMTKRTWAGLLWRDPSDGAVFAVVGRNGEGPGGLVGEFGSIYQIDTSGEAWSATLVFLRPQLSLTASVAACDIDHDGTVEVFFNNYGSMSDEEKAQPAVIQRIDGEWDEASPTEWVADEFPTHGPGNYVQFADINGDGFCDFFSAHEVAKWNNDNVPTFPDEIEAYVILNDGSGFRHNQRIDLPNPHFDTDSAFFSVEVLNQKGQDPIVFTTASAMTDTFKDYYMQLWRFRDGAFTDATDLIDKQIKQDSGNHRYVRFTDIDGDGDQDVYLGLYRNEVAYYRNRGDRFTKETILPAGGGILAVAFLHAPGRACADLVTIDKAGNIRRHVCR